jgi:hypothetical protein
LPSTFFASPSTAASNDDRRSLRFAVSSSAGATSCTLKPAAFGSPVLKDSKRPPRKADLPSSHVNEGLRGMATYGGRVPAKPSS